MALLKQLAAEKQFTIEGMVFELSPMPFKTGRKIVAFLSKVEAELSAGSVSFIDSDEFDKKIEPLLMEYTEQDGFKLSTMHDFWDNNQGKYIQFVTMALQGHAAPFFPGLSTNSHSTATGQQTTTLKKPM